jgi:16S rRNA G527 N7-methylase RsmG
MIIVQPDAGGEKKPSPSTWIDVGTGAGYTTIFDKFVNLLRLSQISDGVVY